MAEMDISCTLGPEEGGVRLAEWERLVGEHVSAVRRISPTVVELVLEDAPEVILGAVDLARREHDCCGFLDISLDLRSKEVLLVLRAPAEAEVVLDTLVGPSAG